MSSEETTEKKQIMMGFQELIEKYQPGPVVTLLAAAQITPVNHSRVVRLEQMARLALAAMTRDARKPLAHWPLLKQAVESYTDYKEQEGQPTTAFTENAVFNEGNMIVYPGVQVSGTRIFNEMMETIFLTQVQLPQAYKKEVSDACNLLLLLSDRAAAHLDHTRNMYADQEGGDIVVPDYETAMDHIHALKFSKALVDDLCNRYHWDSSVLDHFLITPGDPSLQNDDPNNNPVSLKPLWERNDEFILYMPTAVIPALIAFIHDRARHYECHDAVVAMFLDRQFGKACEALKQMGWLRVDAKLPAPPDQLPVHEAVFMFDRQKFGYLCYIGRPANGAPAVALDTYHRRTMKVVAHLANRRPQSPPEVLILYVLNEIGEDMYFAWPSPPPGHLSMTLTVGELDAIAYQEDNEPLTLWKYAKTFHRSSGRYKIHAHSTLDAYAAYQSNRGSFHSSEEAMPDGSMLMIPVGYGNPLIRQVQLQRDEHAVGIFVDGQLGYTQVYRYRQYAPIYVEKEQRVFDRERLFRLVIEAYKMPIWVTTRFAKGADQSQGKILCEGIAFWLYKMRELLAPLLQPLKLVQFAIEVSLAPVAGTQAGGAAQAVPADQIPIGIAIDAPIIKIQLPAAFLQLFPRTDNLADKKLMHAVLDGLNQYVIAAGNPPLLTPEIIEQIIRTTLHPVQAKMFLTTDYERNVKLDPRGLYPMTYLQEADISHVLDKLTSYLPQGVTVPTEITDPEEKRKLCFAVTAGLIQQITQAISQYDGAMLIETLIRINERCIQKRESNRLFVPARIACFSDFDGEVEKIQKESERLAMKSRCVKTLIEWVATNPPTGTKEANADELDELLSWVYEVISWGSLADSIWKELDDPWMGLLPSGRIGVGKALEHTVYAPYAAARATTDVMEYLEEWESFYASTPAAAQANPAKKQRRANELELAFQAETGIALSKWKAMLYQMIGHGLQSGSACIILPKADMVQLITANIPDITPADIDALLDLLTLKQRPAIGTPQKGFSRDEIYPWRHKRALSYMRRPLTIVPKQGKDFYYYGYRQVMEYHDYVHDLLYSGKYPNAQSVELQEWLGGAHADKGGPFRDMVASWFEKHTGMIVFPHEIHITPTGHLVADRDYGDIDLLVIDHLRKILYVIELKNITGAKTPYEMWSELAEFLGAYPGDKDAKITKHAVRAQWLNDHRDELDRFVPGVEGYQLKSFLMSTEPIPLAYQKKHPMPLAVKSFVFLRKEGAAYLDDL